MTAPFTDLRALATHLRALAGEGAPIVLDDTLLSAQTATALSLAFAVESGSVAVSGLAVSDIPDPSTDLVVTGGVANVLSGTAIPVALTFSVEQGDLAIAVVASTPSSWTITDTFPDLDLFPFTAVSFTDVRFVYSSTDGFTTSGPPGVSTVTVSAGQNLVGTVGIGGTSLVTALLGDVLGSATQFPCWGPFAPTAGQTLPVGAIVASLAEGAFTLGTAPYELSLANPRLAVTIGAADDSTDPVQDIALSVIATFQDVLDVAVAIPMAGDLFLLTTTPLPGSQSVAALIESLPGGDDFMSYLPSDVEDLFTLVGLDSFALGVTTAPEVTYVGLTISTTKPWPVIAGVLDLEGLALDLEVADPSGLNVQTVQLSATASFLPTVFTEDFSFVVELQMVSSWEVEQIVGGYYGAVTLAQLATGLLPAGTSVPDELADFAFSDFGLMVTRPTPGDPFTYTGYGTVSASVPLLDTELTAALTIVFATTPTGHSLQLGGALAIGPEAFTLKLDLGTPDSLLRATWKSTGNPLGFADVAAALGWTDIPTMPGDLDINLTSAGFSYDFTSGLLVFVATSSTFGQFVLASTKDTGSRAFLVDLSVPFDVSLKKLPVVGAQIPGALDVGVASIDGAYGSATFSASAVTALNAVIEAVGGTALTFASVEAGLVLVAELTLGDSSTTVVLPFPSTASTSDQASRGDTVAPGPTTGSLVVDQSGTVIPAEAAIGPPVPATPQPAPSRGAGLWVDVGASFGPFALTRVGLTYADQIATLAFDASIRLGPLTLAADGLGIGSSLASFSPEFALTGLGISYSSPPLEIGGSILRVPSSQLPPGVTLQLDGTVVVSAESFTLAGVASYAEFTSGLPSLFVFVEIGIPLGGPPAFFVTGLMGGFGFNAQLVIPGQDEVAAFPLLAMVSTPPPSGPLTPAQVLQVLEGRAPLEGVTKVWVSPRAGSYWLAAGLQFTTYELLRTSAMLVAEFGDELVFALLGLSTMELPLPESGAATCAFVELQLRVVLKPTEGSFEASAILSRNSYVLTPECHLTGGFAMSIWFGDNPNAGQFVLTIGGYHPAFTPPSYFPVVPRLGFRWAVSDVVSITGGAYFALTTSCAMTGGSLEVLYQSGNLKAWFIAVADFLVSWHPFFYDAHVAVSIGASYRLSILGCHKTITASLGADLRLWGPPTGGTVRVDLVVVSFTVAFGSQSAPSPNDPLLWPAFSALLPEAGSVCSIASPGGLTTTTGADSATWVVRAASFGFETRSAIPVSTLSYAGKCTHDLGAASAGIAIRPMNLEGVESVHTLAIYQGTATTPTPMTGWNLEPITGTMPAALWAQPPAPFTQRPATPSADVVANQVSGYRVTAPAPTLGDSPGPLTQQAVAVEYLDPAGQLPWVGEPVLSGQFVGTPLPTSVGQISQIDESPATDGRNALFDVLAATYLPDGSTVFTGTNDHLTILAQGAGHLYADAPMVTTGAE